MVELPVYVALVLKESDATIVFTGAGNTVDETLAESRERMPNARAFVFPINDPDESVKTFRVYLRALDVAEWKHPGIIRAFVRGVREIIDELRELRRKELEDNAEER